MTDELPLLELRHYRVVTSRVRDWEERFYGVTVPLFAELGMRHDGVWRDTHDDASFYYALRWTSEAEMEQLWDAYGRHPEWQAAKAASEQAGPVVEGITRTLLTRHQRMPGAEV